MVGLCYLIQHLILKEYKEITDELSCTQLPQKWGIPHSTNKSKPPECIINKRIYAPKTIVRKKSPISCTLKENPCKLGNNIITQNSLEKAKIELKMINSKIGLAYLLPDKIMD